MEHLVDLSEGKPSEELSSYKYLLIQDWLKEQQKFEGELDNPFSGNNGSVLEQMDLYPDLQQGSSFDNEEVCCPWERERGQTHTKSNESLKSNCPLVLASSNGEWENVRSILQNQKGLKVNNVCPETGKTPLHFAAKGRQFWLVRELLERGAGIGVTDKFSKHAYQFFNDDSSNESFPNIDDVDLAKKIYPF